MSAQKYHIKLKNEERKKLKLVLRSNKRSMEEKSIRKFYSASMKIPTKSFPTMNSNAAHIGVSEVTTWKIGKRCVEVGLDSLLGRKKRDPLPGIPL